MKTLFAMMAVVIPTVSAAAQTSSDVIWKGDFDTGASSLTGNCSAGQNQWCNDQMIRAAQIQTVASPLVQGKFAARFEVKFGDNYNGYSDSRSLMTGPSTLWEDEGTERWYRWQSMWPSGYVGTYPKWDQLSTPSARSNGGSVVEWHHDAAGAVETGSAPLYIGANDNYIWLCLVDQTTSTCRESINLATLIRGHWHDIVMHAKWSSNASIGFVEFWVDGVHVLTKHMGANKYPNMKNYLVVGLYRNGEIGDPNLKYANGTHVYGTDGAPGVVYLDGFIVGKTQASVMTETLLTDAAPVTTTPDAGTTTPAPSTDAGTATGTTPEPDDAGTVATTEPIDAGISTPTDSTDPTGGSSSTSSASPNVTASSLGGGSGGCSSGGFPVVWTSLIGLTILLIRARRRTLARAANKN
ncbi:MAG TPA: polysaccharide lyase [Myxococcales bacterium]|nr:polysaccharide lyase [Myxococcales bacterium]